MKPVVARPKPCLVALQAGRAYYWCSCGRSARQPFCDGSHQGTGFEPLKHVPRQDEEVLLCCCKHTGTPPFCDGAHTNLPGGSPVDDPEAPGNRDIPVVKERIGARTLLDGCCYVISPSLVPLKSQGKLRYGELVAPEMGSVYQTQIFVELEGGASPVMTLGDADAILFIGAGSGTVTISGRHYSVTETDGVYVRPGEAVQFAPASNQLLRVFMLACPAGRLGWLERMPDNFDTQFAQRVVSVDGSQRVAMGPRYFQLLVDKRIGSRVITQFIGHIPRSKAAPHRHLYEEALLVLSGEGYIWTETRKARVASGDVIFLPRKQLHSLEATCADGIDVVGVICPGDNPSINYYD